LADAVGEMLQFVRGPRPLLEAAKGKRNALLVKRVGFDPSRALKDDGIAVPEH